MIKYNKWLDSVERRESYRGVRSDYRRLDMSERIFSFDDGFFNSLLLEVDQNSIITYPSRYEYSTLKKRIAVENLVSEDQVIITPGSGLSLRMVFQATCTKGKEVVTTDPHFPMYDVYAGINGSTIKCVKYNTENLDFSIEEIIEQVGSNTRLVILSNPNSPVGNFKGIEEIRVLCAALKKKGIALVIDEAYYEFSPGTCVSLVNEFDNLVVTRTLSKACGLAGMRVGYLITSKKLFAVLDKLRYAFPLTSLSTRFAIKLFENIDMVKRYSKMTVGTRQYLAHKLPSSGYDIVNTHSNWIHINSCDNNRSLKSLFDSYGISSRFGTSIPGDDRDNWLRLTVGPKIINKDFIKDMLDMRGDSQ